MTPSPAELETAKAQARARLIERMGDHLEAEGLPRIAGRLFGLMILEEGPASFTSLAERLCVSRGSISTNARLLEGKGLLVRVKQEGDRQEYFCLAENPFANLIRAVLGRMEETIATLVETRAGLPHEADLERRRLDEAECFFRRMTATLTQGLMEDDEKSAGEIKQECGT